MYVCMAVDMCGRERCVWIRFRLRGSIQNSMAELDMCGREREDIHTCTANLVVGWRTNFTS
jgi:hypothetical protein